MERLRLVLIGNGMAGCRTLEELLALAPDLYDITVFGAEPYGNYNRVQLSAVLAGEMRIDEIMLNDLDWYRSHDIRLFAGDPAISIDRARRRVVARSGATAEYDRLMLATGSSPIVPQLPGHDLSAVVTYRNIDDVNAMIDASADSASAVVIGGGLLGLEAASGLGARGLQVTVVHLAPWLMERQLDRMSANMLQGSLEERGLLFRLDAHANELLAATSGRVRAVRLSDGSEIPADLVVMAVGIRPNDALAETAGLYCDRGIVVSDTLQTYDPRIYAVGECAVHRGIAYGLVAPLFEQAKICANHLAELGIARYAGSAVSARLKVAGIDLFSAGDITGSGGSDEIVLHDRAGGVYKRLLLRDDTLVGAILYGDTSSSSWYFQLLREGRCVRALRRTLAAGSASSGDAGSQGAKRAAELPDDFEVCGCNGVTRGSIVRAIKEKGLFSLDAVRKHTRASASCGSCTGLVEQILAFVVGGAYVPQDGASKPMCGCTDHTHEEVRHAIREHELKSIFAVMRFCEWRSATGCPSCRPALNYYLLCAWPHEFRDDPQSRLANERTHANIQKDGTYSVVPRIPGGITTPAELRRIADVAERYAAAMVKITGGQRIDLLGIRREDLPRVWADLDMPSGFAYGRSIRTVKTCVGSRWCRFGVQDSVQLGLELETAFERMWAPHKVKLGVSGCPRNCAEAGVKDIGVVGVDSGWEIYVAGNGGTRTQAALFLVKVKSTADVLEHAGAFLQLYREEARYLERTAHWVERVGIDSVKKRVVDDPPGRAALHARLIDALAVEKDPWRERIAGAASQEYVRLGLSGSSSPAATDSEQADARLEENLCPR